MGAETTPEVVRLTDDQREEIRTLAEAQGRPLRQVHEEFIRKLLTKRKQERKEGTVHAGERYKATLKEAKTQKMILDNGLLKEVEELAEQDHTTVGKILYTSLVEGIAPHRPRLREALAEIEKIKDTFRVKSSTGKRG